VLTCSGAGLDEVGAREEDDAAVGDQFAAGDVSVRHELIRRGHATSVEAGVGGDVG